MAKKIFSQKWNKKEIIQFMIEELGYKEEGLKGHSKAWLLDQIPEEVTDPYRKEVEKMWKEMG